MKVFFLLTIFGGIFLFEVPGLVYRKYWKELIVFLGFLGIAFLLSLLAVLGIEIPNPAKGIEVVVKAILQIFSNIFS